MSGTWPMILANVAWVVSVTTLCARLAIGSAFGLSEIATFVAVASTALFAFTAVPLRYFLLAQRRIAAEREAMLSEESGRRHFESQLVRALEMTDVSDDALNVARRALEQRIAGAGVEIMLADSSRAHLTRFAGGGDPDDGRTCCVDTPRACPAVRAGHALSFNDTTALDACPHVQVRSASCSTALCIPVNIMGSTTGVIHLTHHDHAFAQRDASAAVAVAQQLGSRLGLVSAMAQSELQASTDPLTGLLNRRSLEHQVRPLIEQGVPFAVVLADLDHFKVLNDTHGHDAGDRALRVFARVLRAVIRGEDLACRYGGEEFVLILPRSTSELAAGVVDRLRLELHTAFTDGTTPAFTVSAGVIDTTYADDLAGLITSADRALLQAKAEGRNRTVTHTASSVLAT